MEQNFPKRAILDLDEYCEGAIVLSGYNSAIIGVVSSKNGNHILYSKEKIIDLLRSDGMTYEEAEEFFDYNIATFYPGQQCPIFLEYPILPINGTNGWRYEIIS